jgi:hypothetical protein
MMFSEAVSTFVEAREEAQILTARAEEIAASVEGIAGLDPAAVIRVGTQIAKADRWPGR